MPSHQRAWTRFFFFFGYIWDGYPSLQCAIYDASFGMNENYSSVLEAVYYVCARVTVNEDMTRVIQRVFVEEIMIINV